MSKERVKGIVIGFVLCAVLSAGVIAVGAQTVTRNITYGVGVILNGQQVRFDNDSRPFVMDGRTFLPLRTLAELLDLPVDFDPANNNAIVGTATAATTRGTSLATAAPIFDRGRVTHHDFYEGRSQHPWIAFRDNISMGGTPHNNALYFRPGHYGQEEIKIFSLHNLNGRYTWLNGHIGRVDGTGMIDVTINIYGDDRLLQSYEMSAGNLPIPISVFVEDVRLLKIELIREEGINVHRDSARWRESEPSYALVGFLE